MKHLVTYVAADVIPAASARTVTRYTMSQQAQVRDEHGDAQFLEIFTPICLYAEVAPLLTALAEAEHERDEYKAGIDGLIDQAAVLARLRQLLVHPVVNRLYQDAVDAAFAATERTT